MSFAGADTPLSCLTPPNVDFTEDRIDLPAPLLETDRTFAAERLRRVEKAEAIGQLVAGVAHDFNNLLGVVVGNLDRAGRTLPADTLASRHVADAVTATDRAIALVRRLLAFIRHQPLLPEVIEIDTLLLGLRPLIELAALGCAIVLDLDCAWHSLVDANQLENAILNLVVNARDAMPSGGRLTIATRRLNICDGIEPCRTARNHVQVTVSDTGTGMTAEVREKAVEPLFTTKATRGGTGLGLSQVGGFIAQCGGTMHIESEVGTGTSITLRLPRAAPAIGPSSAPPLNA